MSRILVALDDSCGGEKALEAAVKLAQQDGGRLTAVTVLEQTGNPALDQLMEDVKARAKNRLEELLHTAANYARSRGVRLTPILREGHPAESILRCAEEEQAGILVLGASSRADGDPGLGDTADQVSNHCACTVLIARKTA
jgi:nucleotide-binding universal stress UspA family protein